MKLNCYEVSELLEKMLNANEVKGINLTTYNLIYLIQNIEQAIRLTHYYDLSDEDNKDMLDLYSTNMSDASKLIEDYGYKYEE